MASAADNHDGSETEARDMAFYSSPLGGAQNPTDYTILMNRFKYLSLVQRVAQADVAEMISVVGLDALTFKGTPLPCYDGNPASWAARGHSFTHEVDATVLRRGAPTGQGVARGARKWGAPTARRGKKEDLDDFFERMAKPRSRPGDALPYSPARSAQEYGGNAHAMARFHPQLGPGGRQNAVFRARVGRLHDPVVPQSGHSASAADDVDGSGSRSSGSHAPSGLRRSSPPRLAAVGSKGQLAVVHPTSPSTPGRRTVASGSDQTAPFSHASPLAPDVEDPSNATIPFDDEDDSALAGGVSGSVAVRASRSPVNGSDSWRDRRGIESLSETHPQRARMTNLSIDAMRLGLSTEVPPICNFGLTHEVGSPLQSSADLGKQRTSSSRFDGNASHDERVLHQVPSGLLSARSRGRLMPKAKPQGVVSIKEDGIPLEIARHAASLYLPNQRGDASTGSVAVMASTPASEGSSRLRRLPSAGDAIISGGTADATGKGGDSIMAGQPESHRGRTSAEVGRQSTAARFSASQIMGQPPDSPVQRARSSSPFQALPQTSEPDHWKVELNAVLRNVSQSLSQMLRDQEAIVAGTRRQQRLTAAPARSADSPAVAPSGYYSLFDPLPPSTASVLSEKIAARSSIPAGMSAEDKALSDLIVTANRLRSAEDAGQHLQQSVKVKPALQSPAGHSPTATPSPGGIGVSPSHETPLVVSPLPVRKRRAPLSHRGKLPAAVVDRLRSFEGMRREHIAHTEQLWNHSHTSEVAIAAFLHDELLNELLDEIWVEVGSILDEYIEGLAKHELQ